ncbi:hypothetical protein SAMN02745164_02037 [Marinitoga hydrogenitolerans DSM 16785]|uniref:Uncharacterized protein n=1 Tax=Marinitoga hydrogenitolerans (strain DSM 16785 / JCM 12826 / AT1271) TaxID=1122195 RepID=A0A1M4ZWQ7_MARH1|nr:polysialyltransferase family glycosyltransferase [Marinitoga hydrogenitolerans]SHF22479.1 hypothetical protein SAMN02745164_02037 [Marinitoga hydrogenitolerans DSM 16785]
MNLFIIRNWFSIISAERIINEKNKKNNIALVANSNIEYFKKMEKYMNKDLWKNIEFFNPKLGKFAFLNQEKLLKKYNYFKKILKKYNTSVIYLSNLDSLEEKMLYKISKEMKIKINIYEEGTNLYVTFIYNNNIIDKIKSKIRNYLYQEYSFLTYQKNNFKANTLYSFFPEKYKFTNVINKEKINFDIKQSNDLKKFLKFKSLFLSRPLSEDRIINRKLEIKILEEFLSNFNRDIYFKFHPRESKEKIEFILKNYKIKILNNKLQEFPAEYLIYNSGIENLIGYESGTLAYISEFKKDINVYSLLKKIVENSKSSYLKTFYDFYRKEFKKIIFI